MRINDDYIIFDDGLEVYANNGIIGLAPDGEIKHGYDGGIWSWPLADLNDPDFNHQLKHTHLIELAQYMAREWWEFGARIIAVELKCKLKRLEESPADPPSEED